MPSHSKFALGALALALSCAPVIAQASDAPDDPPSMPDPGGPGGGMHRGGPDGGGRDGGWNRGRDGENWRHHGGFGHERGMRGRGGMEGREMMLGRLLSNPEIRDKVGVTADQVAKIRQQEADFRKTEIRDRADLEVKQIDLREMMAADKPDRGAIDAKLTEISTSRLALEKSAVAFRLNSRDALTADQRTKLRDLMRSRHERDGGPGPGGPRGGARGARRGGQPPAPPANGTTPPANQ